MQLECFDAKPNSTNSILQNKQEMIALTSTHNAVHDMHVSTNWEHMGHNASLCSLMYSVLVSSGGLLVALRPLAKQAAM